MIKKPRKIEYDETRNQNNLIMAMSHQQNQQQMLAVMKSLAKKRKLNSYLLFVDNVFTEKVNLMSNKVIVVFS